MREAMDGIDHVVKFKVSLSSHKGQGHYSQNRPNYYLIPPVSVGVV
jgi:hypothetical protein